jgi:hypothetical protein
MRPKTHQLREIETSTNSAVLIRFPSCISFMQGPVPVFTSSLLVVVVVVVAGVVGVVGIVQTFLKAAAVVVAVVVVNPWFAPFVPPFRHVLGGK